MDPHRFVLTLSCADRPGIVAAVSAALLEIGANINEAHQYNDTQTGMFFARIECDLAADGDAHSFSLLMQPVSSRFGMKWDFRALSERQRVLILVSRFDHCLADLLYRWRIGELAMDVAGVVSNYPLETFSHLQLSDVPFDYLPVSQDTKTEQEAGIRRIIKERKVDLVVLARYMQILSGEFAADLAGRCINIHHSFLPGFKGAKPYHRAHQRGVKLIGATAHYVTSDLDEGPIIEQDVERISHVDTPATLIRKGRDIERRVLSRAVAWHLQARIFVDGSKTFVFKD
jgi:formyltetrahydrofolate deformylase